MKNKAVLRNVALIIAFCAVAFLLFTKDVRSIQIFGLFACGAVVGASLTNMLSVIRTKQQS